MPAKFELIAPCFFGCESTAKFELTRIGAENIRVDDGRLSFAGGAEMIAAANLNLRTVERVMLLLARYRAATFDDLFDGVYDIPWEELLPADAAFPVTGSSLNSQLSSVPACQSIIKKAVVKRLMAKHHTSVLPETGAEYKIRFMLRKDQCEIMLDTTGDGLHKRGYRRNAMEAPIRETLAATIADLGRVRRDSLVEDPFCGSGTLLIEAAQKAMNIAPGLKRRFAAVHYSGVSGVPRDFVELPSQVMEHWVFEPEVLKVYAKHYQTGEVIPAELIEKLDKSGKYGQGFATTEYLAASYLDMDYHVLKEIPADLDIEKFEAKVLGDRGLIRQIPSRYRSTYFGHTMEGGYTAGYYSYIWAEVLDCDAFQAYKETGNIFNPEVASKFRKYVLTPGGIDDAMDMYVNFRGKQPSIDPLLENRGLK